ncbi:DUF892 family protein [Candidatus Nomurabacteria bacterium]|nr:DUF892 family protein [Candidatus Nomurabacteria bacterium]
MTDQQKSTYLAWLNDAHALEVGLVRTLEKQAAETKDSHPELCARIESHLAETKNHAEMVRGVIERHGGDPSAGKDILSQAGALMGGLVNSLPSDSIVKNVHASYGTEQVEIATYTLLTAAAETVGDKVSVPVFQRILQDEIDMGNFLLTQLQAATTEHLKTVG